MDFEVQRFFARSSHLNPAALGKVRLDIAEVVETLHMSVRASAWGETSQTKLCVYGGIPFSVRRNRPPDHQVPVQIWLSATHPLEPPTVYIVPSDDTHRILSNSPYCDVTGLCYLPALAQWSPPTSTLKGLVLQLIKACCQYPPLWEADATDPANGASASAASAGASASASGGDLDDDALCVVCLSMAKDAVLVPCGHFCCCISCATNMKACPVCRTPIKFRQRVFQ